MNSLHRKEIVCLLFTSLLLLPFSSALCAEEGLKISQSETLFSLEERYVEALKIRDYKALYALQHPLFKGLVTFSIFKENEGRVLLDMEKFDRITQLPGIYTYNPFLRYEITGFEVDVVYIDETERYAKIETFISRDLSFSLPVRGPMVISSKVHHYWERVEGNWYVLGKYMDIPAAHISGSMTGYDDRERRMLLPEEYAVYTRGVRKEKSP